MQIINCTRFKRLSGSALARMTDRGPVLVVSHYREGDSDKVTGSPLFLLVARPRDGRDVDVLAAQLRAWLAEGGEEKR